MLKKIGVIYRYAKSISVSMSYIIPRQPIVLIY